MRFFKNFALGVRSFWKAIFFIKEHKIYRYLPIPAILMLVIYYIGNIFLKWQAGWSYDEGCTACSNMNETIWFLLKILISVSIGLVLMKFAKYIVVIVLSPLFSIISQIVEKKITSNNYPFNLQQTLHDVRRGVRIAFRNIMWEYVFFVIILIVSSLGWEEAHKSPVFYLTFVIGFFYYGFSFMDYINERLRLDIDESIDFVRQHRGLAIAIGFFYSILILVPVDIGKMIDFSNFSSHPFQTIGNISLHLLLWILASVAPILTIVAATLAMHELVDLNKNEFAIKVDSQKKNKLTENNNELIE